MAMAKVKTEQDLDLPAGSPTNRSMSIPFFDPLKQLATKSAEQRQQDIEEVNRFFNAEAPTVSHSVQQSIRNTIFVRKTRTDNELFTALRPMDNPEAKNEHCGRRLRCGHPCEEPKVVLHECGLLCPSIKVFTRICGHQTHILCSRAESFTTCRDKCGKMVRCGHKCRLQCHYPSECPAACNDFHCKVNSEAGANAGEPPSW